MNTSLTRRQQVVMSLSAKADREAFVEALISVGIPAQLHEMRERRGWTQTELGKRAAKAQALICKYEGFGYGKFTLKTLRELAAAFDVGLKVQFVPFSELVDEDVYPELKGLDVPSFDEDWRLSDGSELTPGIDYFARTDVTFGQVFPDQTVPAYRPVVPGGASNG